MLSENLKKLRKAKGFSQEELAIRLNVVRQTVSKWEKGLSVPDADMLLKIAENLEVSVSELLGAEFETNTDSSIVDQLTRINEQLAVKNRRARRIWKAIAGILIAIVLFNVLTVALFYCLRVDVDSRREDTNVTTTQEVVQLH